MRALVTGSSGFIGRHVSDELLSRGYVVGRWDIALGRNMLDLIRVPRQTYDLVVHCAARSPHRAAIDGDPGMHAYNVMLDAAMFDWAVHTQQRRVVYFSSCAALDGPIDGYASTKLTGEWLAEQTRRAGVPVTVVRPYSGYGEDQSADFPFRAMVERARRREDPFTIWGDGTQVRDWIHVDDVVAGALAVAESGTAEPVSLCTGIGVSMMSLAKAVCAAAGYEPRFELRGDKPAGVPYRVGNPSKFHEYHLPRISLQQGVERAMGVAACR